MGAFLDCVVLSVFFSSFIGEFLDCVVLSVFLSSFIGMFLDCRGAFIRGCRYGRGGTNPRLAWHSLMISKQCYILAKLNIPNIYIHYTIYKAFFDLLALFIKLPHVSNFVYTRRCFFINIQIVYGKIEKRLKYYSNVSHLSVVISN